LDGIYEQLRRSAARLLRGRSGDLTMDATALAHEACLRLLSDRRRSFAGSRHLHAVAVLAMRQTLVDHLRRGGAVRRGGGHRRIAWDQALEESISWAAARHQGESCQALLGVSNAMDRLSRVHPRRERVVALRGAHGLGLAATAAALGVSRATIAVDWREGRAWLLGAIAGPEAESPMPAGRPLRKLAR
jgi:RNA polymerase sigma factor (TIGR02999 family)